MAACVATFFATPASAAELTEAGSPVDCLELSDERMRGECYATARARSNAETDRLIRDLNIVACAKFITTVAVIDTGRHTAMKPSAVAGAVARNPEAMKARLRTAIERASERVHEIVRALVTLDGEKREKALEICADGNVKLRLR